MEHFKPDRANLGTTDSFLAVIDTGLALPYNIPLLIDSGETMPEYLLTYGQSPHRKQLIPHEKIENVNWFVPNSLYWFGRESLYLPYLPYFSNCESYGDYIPL